MRKITAILIFDDEFDTMLQNASEASFVKLQQEKVILKYIDDFSFAIPDNCWCFRVRKDLTR